MEFYGDFSFGMRINPFATHSDRVVRHGIPNGGVGNEVKINYFELYSHLG